MIKSYLLIGFRNLRKHLTYSLVTIVGLGLGLATCLLLVTWIRHELSYDRFNNSADRIYRASLEYSFGGQVSRTSVSPTALLPAILTLPETQTGARVVNPSGWSPYIVAFEDKLFQENKFYAADSTFFDVFSYRLLKGNPQKALAQPYNVIVTESTAKKYFGSEDAIGKILKVNSSYDYVVTGVIEDAPTNSLFQFDFIASFNSLRAGREEPIWWSANYQTFIVLQEKSALADLVSKTNVLVKKAVGGELSSPNDYVRYNFIKLTDIYLKSDFNGEPEVVSSIQYIYIFSVVAALILLIACINYINLATARAADRAKEVGVRKVVGALRKQLFTQFIGESILITLLAFCFAFFLALMLLPLFNDLTGKNFNHTLLLQPSFAISSLLILVVIGLLAGAYPALVITSFKSVSVLKGNFKTSGKGIWLRKSLVVFQFGISVVLITGTLIIIKQLDFIRGKNLGYDRNHTIMLPLDTKTSGVFETLQTELTRSGAAEHVGRATESPVNIQGGYSINSGDPGAPGIIITGLLVDEEYIPAIGIQLVQGRNFTKQDVDNVNKDTVYTFILNETALATLFIKPSEALGKKVSMGRRKGEIIGVIKDFHFASLHKNISPLVIFPEEQQFSKIFIRIPEGNIASHLEKIRSIYNKVVPHRPFEYQFLDQQYTALYINEQRMGSIFIVFATLAIIIACLGLLGLVSFSAAQKTKEIGIRKVLGATPPAIVVLITKDFTRLIVFAIVLGLPLAYWMMSRWLSDFAYKTDIGFAPIVTASAICIVIALGTAGYQAMKASLIDPAKTLRNE
jgi:putative ABC transport system permease protein